MLFKITVNAYKLPWLMTNHSEVEQQDIHTQQLRQLHTDGFIDIDTSDPEASVYIIDTTVKPKFDSLLPIIEQLHREQLIKSIIK